MIELRISLLKEELDSLKRKDTTGCNMDIVERKATLVKGGENKLVDRLRRDSFDLYASVRQNVDQPL